MGQVQAPLGLSQGFWWSNSLTVSMYDPQKAELSIPSLPQRKFRKLDCSPRLLALLKCMKWSSELSLRCCVDLTHLLLSPFPSLIPPEPRRTATQGWRYSQDVGDDTDAPAKDSHVRAVWFQPQIPRQSPHRAKKSLPSPGGPWMPSQAPLLPTQLYNRPKCI